MSWVEDENKDILIKNCIIFVWKHIYEKQLNKNVNTLLKIKVIKN